MLLVVAESQLALLGCLAAIALLVSCTLQLAGTLGLLPLP
jgi:hypothetical protein